MAGKIEVVFSPVGPSSNESGGHALLSHDIDIHRQQWGEPVHICRANDFKCFFANVDGGAA